MPTFYTYLWLREDGTPYYVGKGTGNRAFSNRGHTVRCPSKNRIIIQEFVSEDDAYLAEKFLIELFGKQCDGGILRNVLDGGEGGLVGHPSFGPRSDEIKRRISESLKGKAKSEKHCRNISKGKTGVKLSEAHRKAIGVASSKRTYPSPEHKQRMREVALLRWNRATA